MELVRFLYFQAIPFKTMISVVKIKAFWDIIFF